MWGKEFTKTEQNSLPTHKFAFLEVLLVLEVTAIQDFVLLKFKAALRQPPTLNASLKQIWERGAHYSESFHALVVCKPHSGDSPKTRSIRHQPPIHQ